MLRLSFHGDRHFTYDARGNLIEQKRGTGGKLSTQYHYYSQNQLVKVEKDGQTIEYAYDPLGRRIRKKDAFGETEFLWNGDVLLTEKRNSKEKLYLYEPDSFKPLAFIENNQCYFYHLDHLGTPQEMTDWEGKVVWSAHYRVYGNVLRQDVEQVQNHLRFQGQYWDEETGLHYNRFRYYDPGTGQFTQQDPIGLLGGDNCYTYAANPLTWVDPLGLTCKELTSWNQFQKDTKGHFANSSEAANSYNKMKEVAAMGSRTEKVNRPDPANYLPKSYIDAHVQKFDQEGGAFIAIQSWMENPDYPNLPPRKFVGLQSEMDSVIDKYEKSGNDWRVLRDELSLGKNVDLSNDEIAYIVIEPGDKRFKYDIPTGREAGAYENEWVPGGKTKGGTTEAALVKSEDVFHDNDINNMVNQFPGSKKIK